MTTDQAFIRAYRLDPAEPPGGALGGGRRPPGKSVVAAGVHVAASTLGNPLASTIAYVSPGETCTTPPIAQSGLANDQLIASSVTRPAGGNAARYHAPLQPTAVKRPLSAYSKAAQAMPAPRQLVPGTLIESLRWPPECRRLLRIHGELFDGLINSICRRTPTGGLIGVIGLFRGVGCTTTACCAAARMAQHRQRIALVDGHFQSPRMSAYADAEPLAWWGDVLNNDTALADAMVRAQSENLDLLLTRTDASATFPPLRLAASAEQLRQSYEWTFIDLGTFFDPISQPAALDLVRHMRIDIAIGITTPRHRDPRDVETAAFHLGQFGCDLVGVIENRTA
jgi:Mrp family chromosome partitioning ATPase